MDGESRDRVEDGRPSAQDALAAFDRGCFESGSFITDVWLSTALSAEVPDRDSPKWLHDRFRKVVAWFATLVRDHRQLHLDRVPGAHGLLVLPDGQVAKMRLDELSAAVASKAERTREDLACVRIARLTNAERAQHADAVARTAMLQRHLRSTFGKGNA